MSRRRTLGTKKKVALLVSAAAVAGGGAFVLAGTSNAAQSPQTAAESTVCQGLATALGNNQRFIDAGAQVVALEALKSRMASDPRTKDIPGLPTVTFARDYTLKFGGAEVEAHAFGRGHTGDDTMVYFPDLKVVMVSDQMISDNTPRISARLATSPPDEACNASRKA